MSEDKTVRWKEMNWKERLKFVLGVLMGITVKYYDDKPIKKEGDR